MGHLSLPLLSLWSLNNLLVCLLFIPFPDSPSYGVHTSHMELGTTHAVWGGGGLDAIYSARLESQSFYSGIIFKKIASG